MSNEYSNPIGFFPHLVFNRVQFWGIVFWAVWHWVGVIHGKIPAVFTSALLKVPKTPFHSTKVICQGSAHWYLWFVSFEMSEFFFSFSRDLGMILFCLNLWRSTVVIFLPITLLHRQFHCCLDPTFIWQHYHSVIARIVDIFQTWKF